MTGNRRVLTDRLAWWLVVATLVVLPFEPRLPMANVGRLTITTVELFWGAALGAWLLSLVVGRRRPQAPRPVWLALAVLLVGGVVSALMADGLNTEALIFVGRSAAGWLLFLAVADLASRHPSTALGLAIVAGATLSAALGLIFITLPPSVGESFGIRDFSFLDARRLIGTFEYPNSAAMYYEASALLALGLAAVVRGRLGRLALVGALAVLVLAMIQTYSRGAIIGLTAGLLAFAAVAFAAHRQRLSFAVATGAVAVLVGSLAFQLVILPPERILVDAQRGLFDATYEAPASGYLQDNEMEVSVTVTNTGNVAWNSGGGDQIALGYRWLYPGSNELAGNGNDLAPIGPLEPGQSTVVDAVVRADDGAVGYRVAWDVVNRGKYFSEYGVPVITTELVGSESSGEPEPSSREVIIYEDLTQAPTREELWRAAVAMTADRPVLGVGPGTFRLRYGAYLGLEAADDRYHSNNLYLELASTTGLIGLAAFAVLVLAVLVPLARRLVRTDEWSDESDWRREGSSYSGVTHKKNGAWLWSAAIGGAVVAFLVHGLLDYFFGFNPGGGLFWAVLGLALAASRPRT